jgi:uncharacterized protein YkwD
MDIAIGLLMLINASRAEVGVPKLIESKVLTVRAEARADVLCARNQWSHEGWRDSFKGLKYTYAGENLAKGFDGATSTHKGLMASPTHKANILKKQYKEVGVGEACGVTVELFKA